MKNLLLAAAVLACSSTKALDIDSSSIYFNKGLQEKANKRLLVASNAFDKAIAFDPKNKAALQENAQVLMEMRQVHKAKENFIKLYELDPSNNAIPVAVSVIRDAM